MASADRRRDDRRRAFGERLRELRREQRLTQEGLAHLAGLDRTYIGSVERGERNVSIDNIWLLADTLGVDPSQLLVRRGATSGGGGRA